jgi:PAS domain S-box-containing protein
MGMAGYALATGLVPNSAPFFPASWLNDDSFLAFTGVPIQLIRGLLALWISASLCLFAQICLDAEMDHRLRLWFRNLIGGAMVGVILLLVVGWFITQNFGDMAARDKREDFEYEVKVVQQALLDKMGEGDRLVKILSRESGLLPPLLSRTDPAIQQANVVLDRFSKELPGYVCYLMDLNGLTIASSNRGQIDSFVGNSYAFRPYFQEAIQGFPGRYWAMGVTSREMGYFASYAVKNDAGQIVGVVVIKSAMREIATVIPQHSPTFIISPSGIIVMSSRPTLVLRSLWPLSATVREKLLASRQFGNGPFMPLLAQEPVDKGECLLERKRFFVVHQPIPWEGWSIVILGSMRPIVQARFLGISVTLILGLLLIGFLTIIAMTIESAARVTTSERLYRTLVEGSPNYVSLCDHEGRYLAINENGIKALGWRKENLLGQRFTRTWPESSQNNLEAIIQQVFHGQPMSFEAPYLHPDGRSLIWQVTMSPVFETNLSVQGFVSIANDITEHKRIEEELQASEAKYRTLIEKIPAITYITEMDGRTLFTSPQIESLLGFSPTEYQSDPNTWKKLIHPDDQGRVLAELLSCKARGGPFISEYRLLTKAGKVVWCHDEATIMYNADGEPLFMQGVMMDITNRREAEEALEQSEKGFRQLFESAADILILHGRGGIIEVNQQACRSLGYTRGELLQMSLFDIEVGYSKKFLFDLWEKKGGEVTTLSGIYRRKDGSTFPVEIRAGEVTYRGQKLRLAMGRDITNRKRAEEALRASKEALEKSKENYQALAGQLLTAQEAERKRLARELHDDLTQRLGALAMDAEKLTQQPQSDQLAVSAKLMAMKDKLVELSIDVHSISRRLHPAILDDLGLNDAIASECSTFGKREKIIINYQSKKLPRNIPKDIELGIYRIIQESLRNISKHAQATEAEISLSRKGKTIHLSIKDNGMGFDLSEVKKKGGVGLASMKERAFLIGGDFSVQSQSGQGTVVEVIIPLSWSNI